MAWPPLLWLILLSLPWVPAEAGPGTVGVVAPAQMRGLLGDTVELPCKLQPLEHEVRVTQVTWTRRDAAGDDLNVAVFHPTQGPSFPEPGRLEFVAARPGKELRDGSLALRGLRADDEANYTCRFAMFPEGSRSARTWLRVLAQPENKAETQEVPLSPLSPDPVPVARCVSSEGRPPARISWSHLDGQANESQVPGHLPGTFTVISLLTLTPSSQTDGKTVICTVEHESFKEPVLLSVTLAMPYPPEVSISGYDDNWYLGRSKATLSCDVRSKPEPTGYDWSTTKGPLPPSAVAQGSRLLIQTVDESINTTFICRVTNALGTGQAELTILVREEPPNQTLQQGLSVENIIILTVGVVVGLALLGFLIYFRLFRRPRRDQHSSSANGYASYTAVDVNARSTQDPPTESTR
ncbi:poliovirus receptor [Mirounga angustirostris]|uniref:poliovirus receptor n=1 Tax=Mirounga angustirostris TaxID=9716 RepID=UPI001E68BE00|nr:poliovirus receptor [Mirounga angustirostris]